MTTEFPDIYANLLSIMKDTLPLSTGVIVTAVVVFVL
jgi:hypothetical protein